MHIAIWRYALSLRTLLFTIFYVILFSHFSKKNWEIVFTKELKEFGLISPIIELPPLDDNYVKKLKLRIDLNNLKKLETIPFAHSYFLVFNKMSIINILENLILVY